MAIDYFDGFDEYSTTQVYRYWNAQGHISNSDLFASAGAFDAIATITTNGGRNSSGSFKSGASSRSIIKTLAAQPSRALGCAVKFTTFSNVSTFMGFGDSGTSQISAVITTSGTVSVKRGGGNGTLLGTTALALTTGTYYYIEFKATIHSISGSFTVNVNGAQWLTASGANTQNATNATANQIAIGSTTDLFIIEFDDLYSEDSGNFLGDCRVETKLPTGDGVSSQFTRSTGATNFSNVDENPATDDTDYNSAVISGMIDLYTYPAIAATSGPVQAVMSAPVMRNDSAGNVTAASVYRSGGTNFFGTTSAVGSTSYGAFTDIQVTDPNTSAAWTMSGVNACQFGVKKVV